MKILLISDTHRRIAPVNELAAAIGADCCFHLGDLCTYTRDSVSRFSADMLYKQLKHTPQLSPEQLASIDREHVEAMRPLAIKYRTYGKFEDYLSGKKHLDIPVYAVPGNNDDAEVLTRLEAHPVANLTFLNAERQIKLEDFLICGIGGDIAEHASKTGVGCISTWAQLAELERKIAEVPRKKILLTHVPPYECEPLMQLVETIKPVLALCGHTHHWDDRMAGRCRILTLPRVDRGYAELTLNGKNWDCRIHQTEGDK